LCWISGGLLLLLGVLLAVLTVELAADPDKWPGRSEAVLAAAERMFRVSTADPGPSDGGLAGAAVADEAGGAGPSSSRGGGAVDAEGGLRQPLLHSEVGSSQPEIVEG
jgi:hypothetical protein